MASVLGPYKLGSDLVATCVNSGGLPPPRLVWWRGDTRIDDTYEEVKLENKIAPMALKIDLESDP